MVLRRKNKILPPFQQNIFDSQTRGNFPTYGKRQKELYFNCYLSQMFLSDVSDFYYSHTGIAVVKFRDA